jgi:CheY-like chemotaxis protein
MLAPFPEIILLDLNMPRLNGMDFLQELWSSPLSKRPRVIILSGSDAGEDKQRAILAGAAGYIVKPITLPQFVEAITIFNQ